jgi:sugar phosphate isomerase/epimerase
MRIGVRAHDFGRAPARELAARVAARGMKCVQLALSKAIAGLDLKPGQLNPGLAYGIGRAFDAAEVQIAVLGCYINPIHPDPRTRAGLLGFFKEHLRHAREFGNGLVALESGSVNADYSPHPDNAGEEAFCAMLRSVGELVEEAERFGVIVGLEAVASHTVRTPVRMRRVLDEIGSNNLQVVFDPVNLLSEDNWEDQDRVVAESLDLFGDRIAIVHAKDFVVEPGGLRAVRAGEGRFAPGRVARWIREAKPGISVLLEETTEATAEASAAAWREAE